MNKWKKLLAMYESYTFTLAAASPRVRNMIVGCAVRTKWIFGYSIPTSIIA